MTTAKHTQGPWTIHWGMAQDGEGHHIVDDPNAGELGVVATVHFHDDHEGETKANARLIAAAPELLEMLEKVTFIAESAAHLQGKERSILPVTDAARSAIARAKGE